MGVESTRNISGIMKKRKKIKGASDETGAAIRRIGIFAKTVKAKG